MSNLFEGLGFDQGYKETSREAYKKSKKRSSDMKTRILSYLDGHGGATDEQMDVHLGTTATRSNRPIRLSLVEEGLVRDSKERRETTSGSKAIVWVLTPDDQIKAQKKLMKVEKYRKHVKRRLTTLTFEQLGSLDKLMTYWEEDEDSSVDEVSDSVVWGSAGYDSVDD